MKTPSPKREAGDGKGECSCIFLFCEVDEKAERALSGSVQTSYFCNSWNVG